MKNKFEIIQPWISFVLNAIKKEIRMDHMPSSPSFVRAHFGNRPLNRLGSEEILTVYEKELLSGNTDLADWVINRWVFKHGDIYKHFAERLSEIDPDFSAIKSLDLSQSEKVLSGAPELFGFLPVYLFSFLNGVVFPEEVFHKLHQEAKKEEVCKKIEAEKEKEKQTLSEVLERHQREIASLQKKHESKIDGLMKKYTVDVEGLKKQIRSLQQQLSKVNPALKGRE